MREQEVVAWDTVFRWNNDASQGLRHNGRRSSA